MMPEQAEALLREMVEIPSPTGQERAIGELLVRRMSEWGFSARLDEVGNAVGEIGCGSRTLVLLGHMDTVPGRIPVHQEGRLLYGRGSVDAKGPLATFISALALAGPPRDTRAIVIGAVEEEGSSCGARHIVDRYRPTFALIGEPSGWTHITLGYKGSLTLRYVLTAENAHAAGSAATGPEIGVGYWNTLCAWAEQFNAGKQRQFDRLSPALLSIRSEGDGFTTRVELVINIRWPLELDASAFETWLHEQAGAAELTILSREVPYRSEKRTPLTSAFLGAIRHCGGEPGFKLKTGTSDMNVVGPAWGCPILAYGPGDSALDHTPNEHIDLGEYERAVQVLTRVLQTL